MSEPKRRDYVTWLDVGIAFDHMRETYGLVGTAQYYRVEGKNGKPQGQVGVLWRGANQADNGLGIVSLPCEWPTRGYQSVPGLLCFIIHRDEDLWLKQVGYMKEEQLEIPF